MGKALIFLTLDRYYKLKMFLEQFGIPACILNSELPAVSRCKAVTLLYCGTYDIIIINYYIRQKLTKRTSHTQGKENTLN